MDDDKKSETQNPSTKPLAVQVVDAFVDGAAAIAKSVVVETAERMGRSAAKTKAGKVASSLVKKAETAAPKSSKNIAPSKKTTAKKAVAKKAVGKKAVGKKAVTRRKPAIKPAKKAVKKASKKSPSKKAR